MKSDITFIGYADTDITPKMSLELIGFSRPDNMSKGVLHKLSAQVLLCKKSNETCALITIDSLGFTVELSNTLRDLVADKLDTTREKIMLCFSHTHSAPNAQSKEYYDFICNRILDAVGAAQKDLEPANAVWGMAKSDIGINRRGINEPVDSRLGILKITSAVNSEMKVLLLRVTAHGNVLSSDNYLISSDYFGCTRELLKKKYNCNIMLIQGAAGDIRPKYQQDNAEYLEIYSYEAAQKGMPQDEKEKYFQQSLKAVNKMASSIYEAVDCVIDDLVPKPIERLSAFSVKSSFSADVPTIEHAYEIAEEAKAAGIDGTDWMKEVKRLLDNNIKQQSADVEIQYFIINDGCLCGTANEAMCKIALNIAEKSGNELLLFNGYTNGCNSYLPTAEEYDKGGYEVLWSNLLYYKYHGRVMPFNRDTADKLVETVTQNFEKFIENK